MAEIPVEKKSSLAWLWLLLALLLIGLLLWWLLDDNDAEVAAVAPVAGVEGPLEPGLDPGLAPGATAGAPGADPAAAAGEMGIAAILANPVAYIGRTDVSGEVDIPEVPTDRGFWVMNGGSRMFAIIVDGPQEVPMDINSGQRLRINQATVRAADDLANLPGEPLDPDTRRILEGQPAFLLVDEDDMEIIARNGG